MSMPATPSPPGPDPVPPPPPEPEPGRVPSPPSEPDHPTPSPEPRGVPLPLRSPRPGRVLLRVAIGLFAIGLPAIIAIFALPLLTDSRPDIWLYSLAMAAPLGLAVAIASALRAGRRAR